MSKFISNAFSLSMLRDGHASISVRKIQPKELAVELLKGGVVAAIGHADLAALVTSILGIEVKADRVSISLWSGDVLFVAQYVGPRLPEGTTLLPDGAKVEFWRLTVISEI